MSLTHCIPAMCQTSGIFKLPHELTRTTQEIGFRTGKFTVDRGSEKKLIKLYNEGNIDKQCTVTASLTGAGDLSTPFPLNLPFCVLSALHVICTQISQQHGGAYTHPSGSHIMHLHREYMFIPPDET